MASNPNKPSVCRRLFQDPPLIGAEAAEEENAHNAHMENRQEHLELERQRARDRWNFDFEEETPLEGDWEWEKVGPEPEEAPMEPGELRQRLQEELGKVQSAEEENHSL